MDFFDYQQNGSGKLDEQESFEMRIAWITVNYTQEKLLPAWIESIAGQSGGFENEIVVVDNSGTIGGPLLGAKILNPGANLGYFPGFNCALDELTLSRYDAIVMANPDIAFDAQFSAGIGNAGESCPTAMVIAPRITTVPGGAEQNPHIANPIGWLRRRYYDVLFSSYFAFCAIQKLRSVSRRTSPALQVRMEPGAIYMAHGACFVLLPSFFERYEKLDDRVFLWGEEALLRKQVADADGMIWYDPSLCVVHHEHSATSAIASRRKFAMMKESYAIYRSAL